MSGTDYTQTTNYGLYKPISNADINQWGSHLNANADTLDSLMHGFLPIAGGAITGPINIIATGGSTPRSLQDRAADVANVLDYGADPTGVADSSVAINAAAGQVAPNGTHKAVYLPAGTYRVNQQINLTACQGMHGDSRGSSVLYVDQAFSQTATAVIFCTAANYDPGPVLRDFGITFAQPSDQGSRANFRTLAAGGTSGTGGTGVAYPWAVAAGSDSFRIQMIRVRIAGAWDGITTNNHNAIIQMDNVEMGALDIGISYGMTTAVLDENHINDYHFWNFGLAGSLWNVFNDGQTIALQVGNAGSLDIKGFEIFCGRVIFNDNTGRGDSAVHITNCMLDGDPAGIEVDAAMSHLLISNIYGSAGTARTRPFISVTGETDIRITNWYTHSTSNYPDLYVNAVGATVVLTNFVAHWYSPGVNWMQLVAGCVQILNGRFDMSSPRTVPLLSETGAGILVIDNVWMQGGPGSGPLISMVTVHPWTLLGRLGVESGSNWTFSLPPSLSQTFYSPATYFIGSVFANGGLQAGTTGGGSVTCALIAAPGSQKALLYYQGANLAWGLVSTGTNDDFQILRYNSSGIYQGTPLSILRSNGAISMAALQASTTYANDAAAATGGVAVGQLYRNGSAVQVRVT